MKRGGSSKRTPEPTPQQRREHAGKTANTKKDVREAGRINKERSTPPTSAQIEQHRGSYIIP